MAFYKSKYTGTEIDQRLAQATYDDAVLAGFKGSKEEFDAILGKLKEIADKAENSTPMESENLETFNKNIVDAINELHRELQTKPDERDVIDQGELEVFKDEIAAKYATKGEVEENTTNITQLQETITTEISDRQTADDQLSERIETLENAGYQNADQVKAEIEKIVGAAPEALDTLKEIGDALNNDPNFAATITNELSKKADKTDLDTKVDWVEYNNTKNIVLPSNGQIFGDFGGDESNSSLLGARIYNAGLENEEKQVEVGTAKVHLNLNSSDKPTVETPNWKETLVLESDIELMPKEIRIPIRTLQDKVYTQEEILGWFGVEDIVSLKKIIAYGGIQYVKYGLSLSANPHYYKMPVEYVAFESANQIKLVFVGLNTNNDIDIVSKYEIIINLDGTIIEGNSNIKVTMDSLEVDLSEYATVDSLNSKVDKVDGKGLSTEDYTTAEKEKLASLENYDDTELRNQVQQTETKVANNITEIEKLQSGKQAVLISEENIKTVNGESLLGSGNITVTQDLSAYQTKNDETLTTTDKTVSGAINELNTLVNGKASSQDITNAIDALDKAEVSVDTGEIISSVSQENGIINVSKRSLTSDDIPTLPQSKINGLSESLNGKQDNLTAGTGLEITEDNTINVTLDTTVFFVAEQLPESPTDEQKKKICIIPATSTSVNNEYTEYVWVVDDEHSDGYWEEFGTYKAEVDLTPYLKSTDAANTYLNKTDAASTYATQTALDAKQDTLVSGTNIKTINNESLLGSGNISTYTPSSIDVTTLFADTASITSEVFTQIAALGNSGVTEFPVLYGGSAIGNIKPTWIRTASGVTNMMCIADNKIWYFEIQGTTVQRAELAIG